MLGFRLKIVTILVDRTFERSGTPQDALGRPGEVLVVLGRSGTLCDPPGRLALPGSLWDAPGRSVYVCLLKVRMFDALACYGYAWLALSAAASSSQHSTN